MHMYVCIYIYIHIYIYIYIYKKGPARPSSVEPFFCAPLSSTPARGPPSVGNVI